MIFNINGGGGSAGSGTGAGLNFKVVGGTTQLENPTENTIWVNTDSEITSWAFSAVEPESPTDGLVWIKTGTESQIVFNALKKNSIQIMPLFAKQYISGAWVEKSAQIYQSGEWKDWIDWSKWIVKDGLYKLPMVAEGKPYDPSYPSTTFTVTEVDGGIRFNQIAGTGMVYWGPFDLTEATTLTIEGDFSGMNSACPTDYMLAVWSSISTQISTFTARVQLTETGATLNVSGLTGQYYVGFTVRNVGYEIVTNLYVE